MTTGEAVDRAMRIRDEITKRQPGLPDTEIAALVVAATAFQTIDWLEDKLERIAQFMPDEVSR